MLNKIFTFEGVDCVGKTSVMKKFNEITDYKFVCFDRGILSFLAYGMIFDRTPINKRYWDLLIKKFRYSHIIVYVQCEKHIIEERMINTGHEQHDVQRHLDIFENCIKFLEGLNFQIIRIDNTYVASRECAERLCKILEEDVLK